MKKKLMKICLFLLIAMLGLSLFACSVEDDNGGENSDLNFEIVYATMVDLGYEGSLEDLIAAFQGDSAYDIAVLNGYDGSAADWLMTLTGAKGSDGITPRIGVNGNWYIGEIDTGVKARGEDGEDGKSVYEIYKLHNPDYTGNEAQWLDDYLSGRLTQYTVTFDANNGDLTYPNIQQISNISKSAKITTGGIYKPSKNGFAFAGWYKERACKNEWVFEDDTVEQNTVLYAKWIDEAILLTCENGKIVSHEDTAWTGAFMSRSNSGGNIVYEAVPDKGYYFEKWLFLNLDGTEWTDESWSFDQHYYNFFAKDSADARVKNIGRGNGAIYLKAVFTNDNQKLEDVKEPKYQIDAVGDASYTTNQLPAKKVKGTILIKYIAASDNAFITNTAKLFGKEGDFIRNVVSGPPSVPAEAMAYIHYDTEIENPSFGLVDTLIMNLTEKSKVTLVEVRLSKLMYFRETEYSYLRDDAGGLFFLERDSGGFVQSPVDMGFLKWTDEYGNILSTNAGIYITADKDYIKLTAHYDHKYMDFELTDGPLRFNPIKGGTEYEVQYNYAANQILDTVIVEDSFGHGVSFNYTLSESFGTVTIPEIFNGKPVTRIADYGFATRNDYVSNGWIQLVSIEKLIIPASIKEVGLRAFSTMHWGISYMVDSPNPYTVEFLGEDTKVSFDCFDKTDATFVLTDGQIQSLLDELTETYFNEENCVNIQIFDQTERPNVAGYYSLEEPNTLFISDVVLDMQNRFTLYVIAHEFRHFYQFAAAGLIDGVTLKHAISDVQKQAWLGGMSGDDYVLEQDAYEFGKSLLGVV